MQGETGKGKLIALEGIRNADLKTTGKRLLRQHSSAKTAGGVSTWDSSGIFFELTRADPRDGFPSPRTLVLLYASDLVFRLRWEIQPALDDGMTVVAAPYVESGMAFGAAAGLPRKWLAEVFSFAPKPLASYRLLEKDQPSFWSGKLAVGFLEFGCATLGASSESWDQSDLRGRFISYLNGLEKRRAISTVSDPA